MDNIRMVPGSTKGMPEFYGDLANKAPYNVNNFCSSPVPRFNG